MDMYSLPDKQIEPSDNEQCEECGASFFPHWPHTDEPEIVCSNCAYLMMSE